VFTIRVYIFTGRFSETNRVVYAFFRQTLLPFDRQYTVGSCRFYFLCDSFLTTHCVNTDDITFDVNKR
jgi:hypothetical protein